MNESATGARTSVRVARGLPQVAHPSVPMTTVLQDRLLIEPPGGVDGAEPTRVGFLSDMPIGDELGGYLDPIILAFEDAMHEGRLTRPVEIVASARGRTTGRHGGERDRRVPRSGRRAAA